MATKFLGIEPEWMPRRSFTFSTKLSFLTTHSVPNLEFPFRGRIIVSAFHKLGSEIPGPKHFGTFLTIRSKMENHVLCEVTMRDEGSLFPHIINLREKVRALLNRSVDSITGLDDAEVIRGVTEDEFRTLALESDVLPRYMELDNGRLIVKRLNVSVWHTAGEAGFLASMFDTVTAAGSGKRLLNKGAGSNLCNSGIKGPDVLYGCHKRVKPPGYNDFCSIASLGFEVEYAHLSVTELKIKFRDYFSKDYPLNILIGLKIEYLHGEIPGPHTPCTVLYTDRNIFPRIIERQTVVGHPTLPGPEPGFPSFPVISLPLALLYAGVTDPPTTPRIFLTSKSW